MKITIDSNDHDSLAAALAVGITTTELLHQWLDDNDVPSELVDDCLVMEPDKWYADDGNAEILVDGAANGYSAAKSYVETGDWDDGEPNLTTFWVNVGAYRQGLDSDGEWTQVDEKTYKIAVEPEEPECEYSGHHWDSPYSIVGGLREDPGVHGNGGGVVITNVCLQCGCERKVNTWAQDPQDGEQGLESTTYRPSEHLEAVEDMSVIRARESLEIEPELTKEWYECIALIDGQKRGVERYDLIEYGRELLVDPEAKPDRYFGSEIEEEQV